MAKTAVPAGWPKDRPLAVCVDIMCEAWTDDSAPGIGPMGNPLKPGFEDTQARSWALYGMNVGAWRLLDIVKAMKVPASVYASGMIAERWPDLVRRVLADGHPLATHAWAQNIYPVYQKREDEEADLVRQLAAFATLGHRPRGFASPRGTNSPNTLELLAKHGFKWTIDRFDQDTPYLEQTKAGPLAVVPFTMEVNDLPLYVRYGNVPEEYTRVLQRVLERYESIGRPPMILDITAHAHVFGRPAGAVEFRAAIEAAKASPHVWFTTHSQLADLVFPKQ